MNLTVPGSWDRTPASDFSHSHQHRHVGIVPAGVHHAHVLAVVGWIGRRPERQVALLGHRQRVHVGSKRDHFAGAAAFQNADDARLRDAGPNVEAERRQMSGNDAGRPHFAVGKLRVLVNVAPPGNHLWHDCRNAVGDGGIEVLGPQTTRWNRARPRVTMSANTAYAWQPQCSISSAREARIARPSTCRDGLSLSKAVRRRCWRA